MDAILSSWGRVFRFVLILCTLGLLIFGGFIGFNKLFEQSQISLEFSDSKTIIKIKTNNQIITQSILAASDCWEKTGISINPGESYKIKVTGKIHTAAYYLLLDVANDTIPMFQWAVQREDPFASGMGHIKNLMNYEENV